MMLWLNVLDFFCSVFIEKYHPEYKRIAVVYNNMGFVHYDQMKLNQAIDFFTKSISLCSYHVRYSLSLCLFYFMSFSLSLSLSLTRTQSHTKSTYTNHFSFELILWVSFFIASDVSFVLGHTTIVRWYMLNKDSLTRLYKTLIPFSTSTQKFLKFGRYVDGKKTFLLSSFKLHLIHSLKDLIIVFVSQNQKNHFISSSKYWTTIHWIDSKVLYIPRWIWKGDWSLQNCTAAYQNRALCDGGPLLPTYTTRSIWKRNRSILSSSIDLINALNFFCFVLSVDRNSNSCHHLWIPFRKR